MSTPTDNLPEPHFQPSSLQPGVSGESKNAGYGPKAAYECGIMEGKDEADRFEANHPVHGGFAVGPTDGLAEPVKDESSLKP